MPSASFLVDAVIDPLSFTIDAWIMGDRWKHSRTRDHFGPESDLYVIIDGNVGKYLAGTPVHWVIDDMVTRLSYLEDWNRNRDSFTIDAWLAANGTYGRGIFTADSVIEGTQTFAVVTLDAWIILGGSFTIDATIMPTFTIDAFIT